MKKYIDADRLKAEIERLTKTYQDSIWRTIKGETAKDFRDKLLSVIDSLQQEQPEPYFYCKNGGVIPKCSDCKRNHSNSPYKTEDIECWYSPSARGTKQCSDYIPIDQPEVDLSKEIDEIWNPRFNLGWDEHSALSMNHEGFVHIARHFYNLGLNARKEE